MSHTTYILYSKKIDKFYIGYSSDFSERLKYHNNPQKNRIWTKRGIPWETFLVINDLDSSMARKIEHYLKSMKSRKFLIELKNDPQKIKALIKRLN